MPLMSNRRDLLIGAPSLAALSARGVSAQAIPDAAHAADGICRDLLAASNVPALSVAVAGRVGLAWRAAYGKADLEMDVDARPEHLFKLGSVGKVLTATAAARMASGGLLDLDAPIARWLPDLPAAHRQTTLRQLLTHRGGIRHYDTARDFGPSLPGGTIDQRAYPTSRDILALFIDDPLVGPVGGQVAYSTFGYTLASLAMEAAAGQAFPELLKAQIGAHFGAASLEEDDPFALKRHRVRGYSPAQLYRETAPRLTDGWANARLNNAAYKWAGGGMLMSMGDLALFGAGHLEGDASRITPAERALLFTPMTEATKDSPPLGLGWRVDRDTQGRLRWHHAGAQEGCRASLVVYPALGLSIALATNAFGTPGNVLKPSSDLADAFA